jgi:hypothetical protein
MNNTTTKETLISKISTQHPVIYQMVSELWGEQADEIVWSDYRALAKGWWYVDELYECGCYWIDDQYLDAWENYVDLLDSLV